ncbi:hypothetical protein N0X72_24700 [Streptomyces carpaticus]|uniref:hypothetical protein n=1 Tax=Streptomyces carpaticus TaxID=285558 RepID=UPI00220D6C96|nr:hypothetical protein N0X72_24700 [Streptomyces carpaticus]
MSSPERISTCSSRKPDFLLWHPRCNDVKNGYICTFDVTAEDFEEINEGSDALVAALAAGLQMNGSRIDSWRMDRFLSPYYSFEVRPEQRIFGGTSPMAGDVLDRFGLAWRISVKFSGVVAPYRYGGIGPYRAIGHDETWPYRSSVSEEREESIVVVADCWDVDDWLFLNDFVPRRQVELIDLSSPVSHLVQARVYLEQSRIVDIEESMVSLLRVFNGRLFSTHRRVTEDIPFWPKFATSV